jgi:hypothetical protein
MSQPTYLQVKKGQETGMLLQPACFLFLEMVLAGAGLRMPCMHAVAQAKSTKRLFFSLACV